MLKARFGLWVFVVVFCVGVSHLMAVAPGWINPTQINVVSEVGDVDVLEHMLDNRYGGYRVKSAGSNADVVITDDAEPRSGYTLVEGALYSPLVLYFNEHSDNKASGFIKQGEGVARKKIDLYTILTSMENNASWSDIGIDKKVADGTITLYIPDERCWYYSAVEELFYITLNGGHSPTEEERALLCERVNALLNKCNECDNMAKAIYDEFSSPSNNHKVFVAPEMLYFTARGLSGENSHNSFVPVYPTTTTTLSLNVYLRNDYVDKNVAKDFWSVLQTKKKIVQDIGWRIKDSTFDIQDVSTRFIKVV